MSQTLKLKEGAKIRVAIYLTREALATIDPSKWLELNGTVHVVHGETYVNAVVVSDDVEQAYKARV